jgi:hypothetical protein
MRAVEERKKDSRKNAAEKTDEHHVASKDDSEENLAPLCKDRNYLQI